MLRGRYGWLSQRNQFILPTFPTRTTRPLLPRPYPARWGREKEGRSSKQGGRGTRTHTERAKRKDTERNIGGNVVEARSRGDSSGLMASLFGSMPHLLINRIASDRLPVQARVVAPRKIIPVKTCPSRERSRSAAFATFSRNRSILVAAEGRDGDRLRLAVGELSKPRRRLLPVANPERTSFSLSPFLASFLSVLCFNVVWIEAEYSFFFYHAIICIY